MSPIQVTDLKHKDRISLGTLGSAEVLGSPTCVYPHEKATLAVRISSGLVTLTLPAKTMVEKQEAST